jgi:hypothetical protein
MAIWRKAIGIFGGDQMEASRLLVVKLGFYR